MGPQEWMWNELKQLDENRFRFKNEEDAYSYVKSLSNVMQYVPQEHYLCASELFLEYSAEKIQIIMDLLMPDKCNIMYLHHGFQKLANSFSQKEPWMSIAYEIEDIPKDWKELWRDDPKFQEKLKLPEENIYIATDFRIKEDVDVALANNKFPALLDNSKSQKL